MSPWSEFFLTNLIRLQSPCLLHNNTRVSSLTISSLSGSELSSWKFSWFRVTRTGRKKKERKRPTLYISENCFPCNCFVTRENLTKQSKCVRSRDRMHPLWTCVLGEVVLGGGWCALILSSRLLILSYLCRYIGQCLGRMPEWAGDLKCLLENGVRSVSSAN